MKKCCNCQLNLENCAFNLNQKMCKKCQSEYNKVRYVQKREYILFQGKQWKCKNILVNRKYVNGVLNPNSKIGMGTITEYIVFKVLGDCIKCNSIGNFNSIYDLISKKYGRINVKASKQYNLNNHPSWKFSKSKNEVIPNYYICLAFNADKTNFVHIWIIPSDSVYVKKRIISVYSESKILKLKEFEVNNIPYNNIYSNLDLNNLPEFRNNKIIANKK